MDLLVELYAVCCVDALKLLAVLHVGVHQVHDQPVDGGGGGVRQSASKTVELYFNFYNKNRVAKIKLFLPIFLQQGYQIVH